MIPVEPTESGTEQGSGTYNRVAMSKLWNRVVMFLSAVGVFIAGVLSVAEATQKEVPCGIDGGCAAVTTSQWSEFMGIKVAYLGLATYVVLLLLAAYRSQARGKMWNNATLAGLALSGFGFGFSVWLQIVSIAQIQEICRWCLASAVTMFLTFLAHGMLMQAGESEDETKSTMEFAWVAGFAILAMGAVGIQSQSLNNASNSMMTQANFEGVEVSAIIPDESKMKGNPDAKVVLIEFADINCPKCRSVYPDMKKLYDQYGGKLKIAFRHFPLFQIPGHETSVAAALVAEMAAAEGKYWEYMDKVMDPGNTERIKNPSGIIAIASEVGLDADAVRDMVEQPDGPALDSMNDDYNLATQQLKLGGTPTFILVAEGHQPRTVSDSEIASVLEKSYSDLLK